MFTNLSGNCLSRVGRVGAAGVRRGIGCVGVESAAVALCKAVVNRVAHEGVCSELVSLGSMAGVACTPGMESVGGRGTSATDCIAAF